MRKIKVTLVPVTNMFALDDGYAFVVKKIVGALRLPTRHATNSAGAGEMIRATDAAMLLGQSSRYEITVVAPKD
jgi:hypothetical protein